MQTSNKISLQVITRDFDQTGGDHFPKNQKTKLPEAGIDVKPINRLLESLGDRPLAIQKEGLAAADGFVVLHS